MIYWMLKKIEIKRLKNKVINKKNNIEIVGEFECTSPESIELSEYIYIGPHCKLYGRGKIKIGTNTIIGNNVTLLSSNHNYKDVEMIPFDEGGIDQDIIIDDNVWIASFVFILPGVHIEEGAVIGGGSVVMKDVPKGAIVAGNPAIIVGYRDIEKYEKNKIEGNLYLMKKYGK